MAKDYATTFYKGRAWEQCRKSYLSMNNLCERCLKKNAYVPAKIVHHKTYITPDNITNPDITLNFNNLEALCQDCHNAEHHREKASYYFDNEGNIIPI